MAFITIGIPTYNRSQFLIETLRSVQHQDYADIEILIADNASSDDTACICEQLAKNDKRIRYIRNPENLGMAGNWKRIAELTTTPYLKYLMDDDLLLPGCISAFAEVARRVPELSLIACLAVGFRDGSELAIMPQPIYAPESSIPGRVIGQFLVRWSNQLGCPTNIMYRTDALRQVVTVWDNVPNQIWTSDILAMLKVLDLGNFLCINRPLVAIRQHTGSGTSSLNTQPGARETFRQEKELLKEFAHLAGDESSDLAFVELNDARHAFLRAVTFLYRRDFPESLYYFNYWRSSPYAWRSLRLAVQMNWGGLVPESVWVVARFIKHALHLKHKPFVLQPSQFPASNTFRFRVTGMCEFWNCDGYL
ncbi:MAG: glycosyltransferase [Deltaproteobacteria bacterium]|nr:glycosyltransferase [Deltaproteobacteria bacterium]